MPDDLARSSGESAPDDAPSDAVLPLDAAGTEFDPVDVALARALADASAAGRFDVVVRLAEQLGARRRERGG